MIAFSHSFSCVLSHHVCMTCVSYEIVKRQHVKVSTRYWKKQCIVTFSYFIWYVSWLSLLNPPKCFLFYINLALLCGGFNRVIFYCLFTITMEVIICLTFLLHMLCGSCTGVMCHFSCGVNVVIVTSFVKKKMDNGFGGNLFCLLDIRCAVSTSPLHTLCS